MPYFTGDMDINVLLEKLSLSYTNTKNNTRQNTSFLMRVWGCTGALTALRYFREDRPDLHIIAAGSLLDFCLEKLQELPSGVYNSCIFIPSHFLNT